MNTFHNPEGVPSPISSYSHGVEVPSDARWLTVSGQIGVDFDGNVGADVAAQSELVWRHTKVILEDAGMTVSDIVKMTAYLVDPADLAAYGAVRTRYLGEHRPASTLIYVSALVKPEIRVEIEVTAARVD